MPRQPEAPPPRPLHSDRRLSDTEALMWMAERDPNMRSSFMTITLLDRAPDAERFRARMMLGTKVIPRLRQRVVESPLPFGAPTWEDDPDFDLDRHIRIVSMPGIDDDTLLEVAALEYTEVFDGARPLWRFTIVTDLAGGRAALLSKMHHVIADGVGALRLSAQFIDFGPEATEASSRGTDTNRTDGDLVGAEAAAGLFVATGDQPSGHESYPSRLLSTAADTARRPVELGRRVLAGAAEAAQHPQRIPADLWAVAQSATRQLMVTDKAHSTLWSKRSLDRRLAVLSVDLDAAKRAAKSLGGTLNDLFVTGVAGACGAYHRELGAPCDELRMTMPISTRTDRSAGGNEFLPSRVMVPAGIEDPVARFAATRSRLSAVKHEPALGLAAALTSIIPALPSSLVPILARQQIGTVDFACSNVRGSPVPLWIGGARILANFPIGPTAGTPFNCTLLSYQSSMDIGLAIDPAAVTEPRLLRDLVATNLGKVIAAGT